MANKDILHDLDVLIRSRYSLIFLDSKEENRAQALLKLLADHMNIPYFTWSLSKGLVREDLDSGAPVYNSQDIMIALGHIESSLFPAIYHFINIEKQLKDENVSEKRLKSFWLDHMNAVSECKRSFIPSEKKQEN